MKIVLVSPVKTQPSGVTMTVVVATKYSRTISLHTGGRMDTLCAAIRKAWGEFDPTETSFDFTFEVTPEKTDIIEVRVIPNKSMDHTTSIVWGLQAHLGAIVQQEGWSRFLSVSVELPDNNTSRCVNVTPYRRKETEN